MSENKTAETKTTTKPRRRRMLDMTPAEREAYEYEKASKDISMDDLKAIHKNTEHVRGAFMAICTLLFIVSVGCFIAAIANLPLTEETRQFVMTAFGGGIGFIVLYVVAMRFTIKYGRQYELESGEIARRNKERLDTLCPTVTPLYPDLYYNAKIPGVEVEMADFDEDEFLNEAYGDENKSEENGTEEDDSLFYEIVDKLESAPSFYDSLTNEEKAVLDAVQSGDGLDAEQQALYDDLMERVQDNAVTSLNEILDELGVGSSNAEPLAESEEEEPKASTEDAESAGEGETAPTQVEPISRPPARNRGRKFTKSKYARGGIQGRNRKTRHAWKKKRR